MRLAKPVEVSQDSREMLYKSIQLEKTGMCCIIIGYDVPDENILAIVQTVAEYRLKILK
jgi:hypothetical protein